MRKSCRAIAGGGMLLTALLLSACGSGHPQSVSQTPAPRSAALKPGETVWHLRAALNVAALSCRGRVSVVADYRRMLTRHRALLDAAYREEQRRYGVRGLDSHQTALYNRFANQRSPERFCKAAADVARRAGSMDSATLAPAAPALYGELQRNLR